MSGVTVTSSAASQSPKEDHGCWYRQRFKNWVDCRIPSGCEHEFLPACLPRRPRV